MKLLTRLILATVFVIAGGIINPISAQADELPDSILASVLESPEITAINVRTGPGIGYGVVSTLPAGTDIQIGCWTEGSGVEGPYGLSTIWYSLSGNGAEWVSDAYLWTGTNDPVTTKCSADKAKPTKDPITRTLPAPTESAYLPEKGENADTIKCLVNHQIACWQAKDAKDWAFSVTEWRFPEFGPKHMHNTMPDAFRHCAWTGAMATRFGFDDALHISMVHEMTSTDGDESEAIMDELNNNIGAQIGEEAVRLNLDDQWGYVMEQCESKARNYELFGLDGIKGNY